MYSLKMAVRFLCSPHVNVVSIISKHMSFDSNCLAWISFCCARRRGRVHGIRSQLHFIGHVIRSNKLDDKLNEASESKLKSSEICWEDGKINLLKSEKSEPRLEEHNKSWAKSREARDSEGRQEKKEGNKESKRRCANGDENLRTADLNREELNSWSETRKTREKNRRDKKHAELETMNARKVGTQIEPSHQDKTRSNFITKRHETQIKYRKIIALTHRITNLITCNNHANDMPGSITNDLFGLTRLKRAEKLPPKTLQIGGDTTKYKYCRQSVWDLPFILQT